MGMASWVPWPSSPSDATLILLILLFAKMLTLRSAAPFNPVGDFDADV
jgi:hypothetical protein